MLKLLIVDDEALVRDGIALALKRECPGELAILKAASGREGLAICEREQPEIIISDVRMPQMNGLDMARALVERQPGAKLIFISAYSEIAYYRAAMKLHAVSFVEKPIVLEELLAEVRRAIELIGAERRMSEAPLSDAEREEIAFLSLLHNNPERIPASVRDRLAPECPIQVFVAGRLRETPAAPRLLAVREAALRALEPDCSVALCGMDGRNCVLLLACAAPSGRRLQALSRALLACFPGERAFLTRAEARGIAGIPRALEAAGARQIYRFFYPQAHFYAAGDGGVIRSQPNVCTPEFVAELTGAIEQRQVRRAARLMEDGLRRLCAPPECPPEHVRLTALHMLEAAAGAFSRLGLELEGVRPADWQALSAPETFDALLQVVRSALEKWASAADSMDESGRSIYQIKREIEKNYADPGFSIAQLASRIHLSESYAGNLFKRKTGMTIGGYLNAVRMERAKQLLSDPSNKVAEVGQKVGIENTDYFARRFKQYTGMTPSEYRR